MSEDLKAYIEQLNVKAENGDETAIQALCAIVLLTSDEPSADDADAQAGRSDVMGPWKKGDAIKSTDGKLFLIFEDADAYQFKIWVNSPGEAPFEIWASEIAQRLNVSQQRLIRQ